MWQVDTLAGTVLLEVDAGALEPRTIVLGTEVEKRCFHLNSEGLRLGTCSGSGPGRVTHAAAVDPLPGLH